MTPVEVRIAHAVRGLKSVNYDGEDWSVEFASLTRCVD